MAANPVPSAETALSRAQSSVTTEPTKGATVNAVPGAPTGLTAVTEWSNQPMSSATTETQSPEMGAARIALWSKCPS